MISRLPYPMRCTVNALSLAILVFLGACSIIPNPFSRSPSPASGDGERRTSPNELLREEIFRDGEADPTAYELVQRLRPNWLRARGQVSLGSPEAAYALVYMNDVLFGGLMTLHQIPPSQIERMEFIRAIDATIRWGTGHTAGVINILTGG
jgi:hypothetical protein